MKETPQIQDGGPIINFHADSKGVIWRMQKLSNRATRYERRDGLYVRNNGRGQWFARLDLNSLSEIEVTYRVLRLEFERDELGKLRTPEVTFDKISKWLEEEYPLEDPVDTDLYRFKILQTL